MGTLELLGEQANVLGVGVSWQAFLCSTEKERIAVMEIVGVVEFECDGSGLDDFEVMNGESYPQE